MSKIEPLSDGEIAELRARHRRSWDARPICPDLKCKPCMEHRWLATLAAASAREQALREACFAVVVILGNMSTYPLPFEQGARFKRDAMAILTLLYDGEMAQAQQIIDALLPPVLAATPTAPQPAAAVKRLPTTESLTGSDPDFTGGLSTEEHLRRIRGRDDEEPAAAATTGAAEGQEGTP